MTNFDVNEILMAIENETNASILELTTLQIQKQKNDILQKLQMPRKQLKDIHKKLKKYRYCGDLKDIQNGYYIRWISLKKFNNIFLTTGGIVCEVLFCKGGVSILCKNSRNCMFQFKFDECLIFQKISQQENVILKIMDFLNKH